MMLAVHNPSNFWLRHLFVPLLLLLLTPPVLKASARTCARWRPLLSGSRRQALFLSASDVSLLPVWHTPNNSTLYTSPATWLCLEAQTVAARRLRGRYMNGVLSRETIGMNGILWPEDGLHRCFVVLFF